jgi:hypothetical protein
MNKNDLVDSWRVGAGEPDALQARSEATLTASAKTGEGVGEAFQRLALAIAGK